MDDAFIVQGGKSLTGEIELSGAKNVALKVIVSSLLFRTRVSFLNIPDIEDIRELLHLFSILGVEFKRDGGKLTVDPSTLSKYEVDLLHGSKIRVSFMLFAPLLYRLGKARIPNPGGCRLGKRPIDRHISMLKSFGVDISYNSNNGFYTAHTKEDKIKGCRYKFEKKTHTGTELAILMAVLASGDSIIENVAHEPEVDDLINFLNQSGSRITRDGDLIRISGIESLVPPGLPYPIMYDQLEAATYGVLALATKGDIFVKHAQKDELYYFLEKVEEAGGGIEVKKDGIRFYYKGPLTKTDVVTSPYPGFRTDWQPQWALLMTQAHGVSTIHETLFENKFGYVDELLKIGAKIDFYNPEVNNADEVYQFNVTDDLLKNLRQAIKIYGPVKLHNGVLNACDIRAGATVLIAACMASGESVVQGASIIDRGYEKIEDKLSKLNVDIKRV